MTLGGTLIVHNALEYDYCVEAAVRSLMGVCDKIVVVDGHSNDGTLELVDKTLRAYKGKWHIIQEAWKPNSMGAWLADLTNVAREALKTDMHFNLQADEVLHDEDYRQLREEAEAGSIRSQERLNFWLDHRHVLPPHTKVGSTIVRLGPTWLPSVGDAQSLEDKHGWIKGVARVMHYGFIREPLKLVAKSRPMQQAFMGTVDPVWDDVEKRGRVALGDKINATSVALSELVPYTGTHPKVAHGWLKERGFNV